MDVSFATVARLAATRKQTFLPRSKEEVVQARKQMRRRALAAMAARRRAQARAEAAALARARAEAALAADLAAMEAERAEAAAAAAKRLDTERTEEGEDDVDSSQPGSSGEGSGSGVDDDDDDDERWDEESQGYEWEEDDDEDDDDEFDDEDDDDLDDDELDDTADDDGDDDATDSASRRAARRAARRKARRRSKRRKGAVRGGGHDAAGGSSSSGGGVDGASGSGGGGSVSGGALADAVGGGSGAPGSSTAVLHMRADGRKVAAALGMEAGAAAGAGAAGRTPLLGALSKGSWQLAVGSARYGEVLQRLLLALPRGYRIVGNPRICTVLPQSFVEKYLSRARGLLMLDSWTDASRFGKRNVLKRLRRRGLMHFRAGKGMLFSTGQMRPSVAWKRPDQQTTVTLLMCRVAVGRCYWVESSDVRRFGHTQAATCSRELPPGFHSYCVAPDDDGSSTAAASGEDGSAPPHSSFRYDVVVNSPYQVLPCFHVEAELVRDGAGRDPSRQWCESCDHRLARLYCKADDAHLCNECDRSMHSTNKLVARHSRLPILASTVGVCPDHPGVPADFFCRTCALQLCSHCRLVGSHSAGEAAGHDIVDSMAELARVLDGKRLFKSSMLEYKRSLEGELRQLHARAAALHDNYIRVDRRITRRLRRALWQLTREVEAKRARFLAVRVRLLESLGSIDNLRRLTMVHRKCLPKEAFFAFWELHRRHFSEVEATWWSAADREPATFFASSDLRVVSGDDEEDASGGGSPAAGDDEQPGSQLVRWEADEPFYDFGSDGDDDDHLLDDDYDDDDDDDDDDDGGGGGGGRGHRRVRSGGMPSSEGGRSGGGSKRGGGGGGAGSARSGVGADGGSGGDDSKVIEAHGRAAAWRRERRRAPRDRRRSMRGVDGGDGKLDPSELEDVVMRGLLLVRGRRGWQRAKAELEEGVLQLREQRTGTLISAVDLNRAVVASKDGDSHFSLQPADEPAVELQAEGSLAKSASTVARDWVAAIEKSVEVRRLRSLLEKGMLHEFDNHKEYEQLGDVVRDTPALVSALCGLVPQTSMKDCASALLHVFTSDEDSMDELLRLVLTHEVKRTTVASTLFRASSVASWLFVLYWKVIGKEHVSQTLRPLLTTVCSHPLAVEVDPLRMEGEDGSVEDNARHLSAVCKMFLSGIKSKLRVMPRSLRHLTLTLAEIVDDQFPGTGPNFATAVTFLRIFCPMLVAPVQFGLLTEDEAPSKQAKRALTLVAKVLQCLANGVEFGSKESFMKPLNPFILSNLSTLDEFYSNIVDCDGIDLSSWERVMSSERAEATFAGLRFLFTFLDKKEAEVCEALEEEEAERLRAALSDVREAVASAAAARKKAKEKEEAEKEEAARAQVAAPNNLLASIRTFNPRVLRRTKRD